MVNINITNVEQLIFKNSEVKLILSDLRPIFDKWLLSYRFPALDPMRKQAIFDLLNSINASHLEKLTKFFQDKVFIERFDYGVAKNLEFSVKDNIEEELNKFNSYNNFTIARTNDKIYVTMVR